MSILKLLPLVVICIAVAMFDFWILKKFGNKSRGMAKLASRLGLPLVNDEGGSLGNYSNMSFILDVWKGREINIHHVARNDGRTQTFSAVLAVPVKTSAELRMTFASKNVLTQEAMQRGLEVVSSGNPEFDGLFYVKSTDVALAKKTLTPEICSLFVRTRAECVSFETLSVREGRIHYEEQGLIKPGAPVRRFEAMVALCHDLANAIDRATNASEAQNPE